MGILLTLIAGFFISVNNYGLTRCIRAGGSPKGYQTVQLFLSFLVVVALNPVRTGNYGVSGSVVTLGFFGGLCLGLLMWSIGRTLEKGPPGLSLAFLNASSIAPAILLFVVFGTAFGHPFTVWNAIGSILVVVGLFWAGKSTSAGQAKTNWLLFVLLIFSLHTLFLVFLQWWSMLLQPGLPSSALLRFSVDPAKTQWFMPCIMLVAAAMQAIIYAVSERGIPKGVEVTTGIVGGLANGAGIFFLIKASEIAAPWENAIIFPVYSVSIILICNTWAQYLYKEAVNWKANAVCVAGLFIGTVAWSAF